MFFSKAKHSESMKTSEETGKMLSLRVKDKLSQILNEKPPILLFAITICLSLKITLLTLLFSWSELKDIFRKCGKVTYTDAHQRIGEGRGEVCFDSADDLKHALKEMQGFDINGRKIEVFKTHVS